MPLLVLTHSAIISRVVSARERRIMIAASNAINIISKCALVEDGGSRIWWERHQRRWKHVNEWLVKETQTGEHGLQAPVRVLMKHLLHNGSSTQRENNFNMV